VNDRPENKDRIDKEAFLESPVEITAFDLSEFFTAHHFKFGDGIILTTDDWGEENAGAVSVNDAGAAYARPWAFAALVHPCTSAFLNSGAM
jgi:hypothetical protein